jgi:DNA polymerase-4
VLERFTPVVEPASIDEFYLDLSGTEQLYKGENLTATASRIRQAVIGETDLPVSIGGGTSKLIAKLAAKRAKPRPGRDGSGVFIVPPGEEQAFLEQLDLADIPMIGPRFQEHLARYGLRKVKEALQYNEDTLVAWFGERSGHWLYDRIRGRDSGHVEGRPRAKSLSHEETFARDLTTDHDLERELLRLSSSVARDLRAKNLRTRTITVKIRDSDFTTRQASHTLPDAISADRPIHETAARLLKKLRRARRTGARLLGVAGSHLVREDDSTRQLALFDEEPVAALETRRDQTIAHAMDEINVKYGRKGIVRAAEVKPKQERESPQ